MKRVVIGIDVGNATTEATMAALTPAGEIEFLGSTIQDTSGVKGTVENVTGALNAIDALIAGNDQYQLERILINDAAPVIADFAMETITETVITDSAMVGHNPDTPGGEGFGTGITARIYDELDADIAYVIVVPKQYSFEEVANWINEKTEGGYSVTGAILQKDEGTLTSNRLKKKIPIVDEVNGIEGVPLNMPCAVEVAASGYSIEMLSDPYGIATVFNLNKKETDCCKSIAKALIGNRSAVVIKTPESDIVSRIVPAGTLELMGENYSEFVPVDKGAEEIMNVVNNINLVNVIGEAGTNIGGMIEKIKINMANSCNMDRGDIKIIDILATDSYSAVPVKGGLAGEYAMENGVALAAMVNADRRFMGKVARELETLVNVPVEVCGVEGEMAIKGALTTPGSSSPVLMLDIGAGSTDVAFADEKGNVECTHLAGAGKLITLLIQSELCLDSFQTAEIVKKYPLGKVESLYSIRCENGDVIFFEEQLSAKYYAQTVAIGREGELYIIDTKATIEKISTIRKNAKKKVVENNIARALKKINTRHKDKKRIVLVGGSVLDFELGNIITEEMDKLRITAGKGNIRGCEGPRNAVATGLIYDYYERIKS